MVVKIGFVGCGGIAHTHMDRLRKIKEARMVAFYDIVPEKAREAAESVGARAYPSLQEMLDKEELDAVYVCVPPFAHGFESEIIERGINIFVEKPVALSMDIARKIESAIRRAGVLSSVGYMWRYFDTTALAKKALEENGPVGMVEGLYIDPFWFPPGHWWIDKRKSGGQVIEQSTHVFDLARYLVGDVARIYAELDTLLLTDVPGFKTEDVSLVTLKFKNGAMGVVLSTCASRKTFAWTGLKVIAKKAVVEHGGHSGTLKIYRDDEIEEIRPTFDPYLEEDRIFIRAIATGDGSEIRSPYSDAVKTLEVTIAANKAAEKARVVVIQ
ncbi:gfo/Idh/MocA family oxidoreductase [Candidatus Bathyarchaeota archaeon]|nr:MAG: gfo/Idh/MocA family oxidoreductase [Candidatus Bathyarchaeota archaeon]